MLPDMRPGNLWLNSCGNTACRPDLSRNMCDSADGNRYLAHEGVIVGSRGAYLCVRMGDEKKAGTYHPTLDMEYL